MGELLVIIGCTGEYLAEFREFPKNATVRKRFEKQCLRILIAGLLIGLFGLFKTTQLSGLEIAQLTDQAAIANERAAHLDLAKIELERQIAQTRIAVTNLEPRRQLVVDLTAQMVLRVKWIGNPTNCLGITNQPYVMRLLVSYPGMTNNVNVNGDAIPQLIAFNSNYATVPFNGERTFYLQCYSEPTETYDSPPSMPAEALDMITQIIVEGYFLPCNAEILGGSIAFTANSAVYRILPIPPLTAGMLGFSYDVKGTNVIPTVHPGQ